jgi:hypothetical protein
MVERPHAVLALIVERHRLDQVIEAGDRPSSIPAPDPVPRIFEGLRDFVRPAACKERVQVCPLVSPALLEPRRLRFESRLFQHLLS